MLGYADRIANYLHQAGGHRMYPLGSEGSLTSQQQRRARKKMNRRRAAAIRRATASLPNRNTED